MDNKENMLEKAISTASQFHTGSIDKIGEPYILHPIRVMLSLNTEKERIVAVLHDTIEDTELTLDGLDSLGFSKEIIEAVDAISKRKGESWKDFIWRVSKNELAKRVKYADIKDNMSPIRIYKLDHVTRERLERKYLEALKILEVA